nr:hypothetical protein CFP56_29428 [Quercus suber]
MGFTQSSRSLVFLMKVLKTIETVANPYGSNVATKISDSMDEHHSSGEDGDLIESSNGKDLVSTEGSSDMEPYVVTPANGRRSVLLSQTPDEKDVKIRELTAELQRERKRSAAFQEQLDMVLRDMEDHSHHLSRNIDDIVQSVREIESKRLALSHS